MISRKPEESYLKRNEAIFSSRARKFEKKRREEGIGRTMPNKKALSPIIAWNHGPHVRKAAY